MKYGLTKQKPREVLYNLPSLILSVNGERIVICCVCCERIVICCVWCDQALLRPGRFDRHILIDLPTLAERKEIFEIYLQKLRLARPVTVYSANLAHLSPSMSGMDSYFLHHELEHMGMVGQSNCCVASLACNKSWRWLDVVVDQSTVTWLILH